MGKNQISIKQIVMTLGIGVLFFSIWYLSKDFPMVTAAEPEVCDIHPHANEEILISGNVALTSTGLGLKDEVYLSDRWNFNQVSTWTWQGSDYYYLEAGSYTLVLSENRDTFGLTQLDQFEVKPQTGTTPASLKFEGENTTWRTKSNMVQSATGASGGYYLRFLRDDGDIAQYQFTITNPGNYQIYARLINNIDNVKRGLSIALHNTHDLSQLGGSVSVTIPDGSTIRSDDVYIFWSGYVNGHVDEINDYIDYEANIMVNGVSVTADSSDFVDSLISHTYWAKIPAAALVGGPQTYTFDVRNIIDFYWTTRTVEGFGIVVPYTDPSLIENTITIKPWGQYIGPKKISGDWTRCISEPFGFSFPALPTDYYFNPLVMVQDGDINGIDDGGTYRPNYLQWTHGTGALLTGAYAWEEVDIDGYIDANKTKGYLTEARRGLAWDAYSEDSALISPLLVPSGTEWIAWRVRIPGDGAVDPDPSEPINSLGQSMTLVMGIGNYYEAFPSSPATNSAWFQVNEGNVGAMGSSTFNIENPISSGVTNPYMILGGTAINGTASARQQIDVGDGSIGYPSSQNLINYTDITSVSQEFENLYTIAESELETAVVNHFPSTLPNIKNYDGKLLIVDSPSHSVNLSSSLENIDNSNLIIFIGDPNNLSEKHSLRIINNITLASSSSMIILVNGDLEIHGNVTQIDGVYLVNGNIDTVAGGSTTNRLLVKGSLLGETFSLDRDLSDNALSAEYIEYQVRQLLELDNLVGKSNIVWQESY